MGYSRLNIPQGQLVKALKSFSEIVDGTDIAFNKEIKKKIQSLKKSEIKNWKDLDNFIDLDLADVCEEILSHPKNAKKQEKIREKLQGVYKRFIHLKALGKYPSLKDYKEFEELLTHALMDLGYIAPEKTPGLRLKK